MFLRAYMRASTDEQDAERAKADLIQFANEHDQQIACFYSENESGATLKRPELMRLIKDSSHGDAILIEQVDRLARLNDHDWQTLKSMLSQKNIAIVSKELPTSWAALDSNNDKTGFTASMIAAINAMMIDMLAAIARKDYDDRRRRQKQGIEKARANGLYKGRQDNIELQSKIEKLLISGITYSEITNILTCSRATIAKVSKRLQAQQQ